MYDVYSRTGNSMILLGIGISVLLTVFVVAYTLYINSLDCVISNSSCLGMIVTYTMFRYTMSTLDPVCSVDNFKILSIFGTFLGSSLFAYRTGILRVSDHSGLVLCIRFYLFSYGIIPLFMLLTSNSFKEEYFMLYDIDTVK